MKFFCQECFRPVPLKRVNGEWKAGRCQLHPEALRVSEKYRAAKLSEFYAACRQAVNSALVSGVCYRDTSLPCLNDARQIAEMKVEAERAQALREIADERRAA